jgi:hypothetical protein
MSLLEQQAVVGGFLLSRVREYLPANKPLIKLLQRLVDAVFFFAGGDLIARLVLRVQVWYALLSPEQ